MNNSHRSRQSGFTLIEVMVAMVILAVGLLGMASLMARSQQSNESAYSRSQATLLAYDIVERMRTHLIDPANADKNYKTLYVTAKSSNAARYTFTSLPTCTAPTGSLPAAGNGRADYDLAAWCARLRATLPGVRAADTSLDIDTSQLDTLGIATVTIAIAWDENSADGAIQQSVEVETNL